ncbi:diadenylate cyclase CdaA [Vagococcus salmoninarum]|uniref:diadenylate cyclase CdaA n=1 Tax=Vagococcus salmoninarum TaxID=2739 RepID=UPI003F9898A4
MLSQLTNILNLDSWNDLIHNYFLTPKFLINILDVVVVWYLIYKLFSLVRGTKAIQLLKGIAVIISIRFVSGMLGLNTVSWLMNQVITYGVIAAIIIFQPEVRRGLEHLGRGSLFKKAHHSERKDIAMVKALDQAIKYMAKRKIGALITIEKNTSLEEYIETGIPIEAEITGELLINIFIPNTPLHDGAVIIRDDKIAAASAYLPLSENENIPKEFGTRHRAAVGISEVSDSLTIIVSEETGDVSLAKNNHLDPHLSQEEYMKILNRELVVEKKTEKDNLLQAFLEGISKGGEK